MLAVVKTPRTEIMIRGMVPRVVLAVLRKEYGNKLRLQQEEDDKLIDVFDTKEYFDFKKRTNPADYVRIYRENRGMTQAALGAKTGMTRAYICDMEKGRRAISKAMAKKMAGIFNTSVSRFI